MAARGRRADGGDWFDGSDAPVEEKTGVRDRHHLKVAAPDGIDVCFDGVGGKKLEAAIAAMRLNGRIIACGTIGGCNEESPGPGPRDLALFIGKMVVRITGEDSVAVRAGE